MGNLHQNYDQLTQAERDFVDACFDTIFKEAKAEQIPLNGADPAERAVDALSVLVLGSRYPAPTPIELPEELPPLPRWQKQVDDQLEEIIRQKFDYSNEEGESLAN